MPSMRTTTPSSMQPFHSFFHSFLLCFLHFHSYILCLLACLRAVQSLSYNENLKKGWISLHPSSPLFLLFYFFSSHIVLIHFTFHSHSHSHIWYTCTQLPPPHTSPQIPIAHTSHQHRAIITHFNMLTFRFSCISPFCLPPSTFAGPKKNTSTPQIIKNTYYTILDSHSSCLSLSQSLTHSYTSHTINLFKILTTTFLVLRLFIFNIILSYIHI
jgi:hypothetical protein